MFSACLAPSINRGGGISGLEIWPWNREINPAKCSRSGILLIGTAITAGLNRAAAAAHTASHVTGHWVEHIASGRPQGASKKHGDTSNTHRVIAVLIITMNLGKNFCLTRHVRAKSVEGYILSIERKSHRFARVMPFCVIARVGCEIASKSRHSFFHNKSDKPARERTTT